MKTAGIDYGLGQSNIDKTTGIRFGVINAHTVNPDALDDIYQNGRDLTWETAIEDARKEYEAEHADDEGAEPFDEQEWQEWNDDGWDSCDSVYLYETDDGYILETTSLGLYVVKSEFYTFASFCSPCCPGAGDLNAPNSSGVKTYCLGLDWFDAEHACPYPVYRVSDNTEVLTEDK